MKRIILLFLLSVIALSGFGQERPDWVKSRPVNTLFYIGIGRALKSEANYQQQAKQNALSDLVSEIRVEVSGNSLLQQLDNGQEVKSVFEENIRLQAKQDIERFQLVDSWENDTEYWVYYELNKFDYEEYMEKRRQQVIRQGFDCWWKGREALQNGDLTLAAEMFMKGLDALQPCINEELICEYEGKKIDIGNELYASMKGVFNGISIVPSVSSVKGRAFQGISEPVIIRVSRENVPLRNLKLEYKFASGAGRLSENPITDERGEVRLYVQNISSKLARQEIHIFVNQALFRKYKDTVYGGMLQHVSENLPMGVIYIDLEKTAVNALLKTKTGSNENIVRTVRSLLTNNYFNIVTDPAVADVTVEVSSTFRKGGDAQGEMYDFTEYFSGVTVNIVNNHNRSALLDYNIEDLKTVVPKGTSAANAQASATRELIKNLNRQLALALKNMEVQLEGEIYVEKTTPTPTPTPPDPVRERPERKPVVVTAPVPAYVEGEFAEGIFIRYIGKKDYGNKSVFEFQVINRTPEDYVLELFQNSQMMINEKGEELKIESMKLGSDESAWNVRAMILPDVPTQLNIYLTKTLLLKLAQFSNNKGMVKLRDLK